ncbi:hypothetical protein [Rhodopseudomonas palustris]|uniref:hypothetical protein n=1 Tax=Rhodopseudomonas palustris TaxID=1076 RepID=UPI00115EA30A|nr:hypothetical protein [Rhodopseudomonas palustris]QDL96223.1 hypothetical protein FLL57_02405 [Rhodopseudomonas palustris]
MAVVITSAAFMGRLFDRCGRYMIRGLYGGQVRAGRGTGLSRRSGSFGPPSSNCHIPPLLCIRTSHIRRQLRSIDAELLPRCALIIESQRQRSAHSANARRRSSTLTNYETIGRDDGAALVVLHLAGRSQTVLTYLNAPLQMRVHLIFDNAARGGRNLYTSRRPAMNGKT